MKKIRKVLMLVAITAISSLQLFASGNTDKGATENCEIIVSAAASLTNAMNDLITLYSTKNQTVKVTPTYGSSGMLRKQIEQGAPSDIFFSAAQNHMNEIKKEGLAFNETVVDLLENKVVLITQKNNEKNITSFNDCNSNKVKTIALGIPESVPAGSYAKQVFESLNCYEKVSAKAIFAKDVRQVLNYVEAGEVDVGVVYATDAAISSKITVICSAPENTHTPIIYPACVVKTSGHKKQAKDFLNFLQSDEAMQIFANYGFAQAK